MDGRELAEIIEKEESGSDIEIEKYTIVKEWLKKTEIVFCYCTTDQKMLIVNLLQSLGHIVALTGD